MQETLLVCSRSTKNYLTGYDRVFVVDKAPQEKTLLLENSEDTVVAIGGGAVIA